MRKLLVLIFVVLVLTGCVSNRKFQAERERVGRIEFQQMKATDNLSNLRAEYEISKEDMDALLTTLESELNMLKQDMITINSGVMEMRNEFADYAERSDTMLYSTLDKVNLLEQGLGTARENLGLLNDQAELQRNEMAEFRTSYDAAMTFNEDVLISFDQRIDELNSQLSRSQGRLTEIDTKYEEMITTESSRLEDLARTHSSTQEETAGMILSTVERIESLERRLALEHDTVSELISIITELELSIGNMQEMVREVSAATLNSVELSIMESREETTRELAVMDGKLSAALASLDGIKQEMGGEISTVRRSVSTVANELTVVANDLEAITSRNARGAARTDRVVTSYNNAKAFYDRGNYEEAIVRLEAFVAANPEHSYVPNARYWIAESYYAGKNFTKAMRSFADVIAHHPTHAKARDAQIKMAMCHVRMGETQEAARLLNNFKEEHPTYHNMALVNRLLRSL